MYASAADHVGKVSRSISTPYYETVYNYNSFVCICSIFGLSTDATVFGADFEGVRRANQSELGHGKHADVMATFGEWKLIAFFLVDFTVNIGFDGLTGKHNFGLRYWIFWKATRFHVFTSRSCHLLHCIELVK